MQPAVVVDYGDTMRASEESAQCFNLVFNKHRVVETDNINVGFKWPSLGNIWAYREVLLVPRGKCWVGVAIGRLVVVGVHASAGAIYAVLLHIL